MFSLYGLLENIKRRPGMYLGSSSIIRLKSYLDGYFSAREDMSCEKTQEQLHFQGFQDWIQKRYRVSSSQSWSQIILFYSSDEIKALDLFFELLEEYKTTSMSSSDKKDESQRD